MEAFKYVLVFLLIATTGGCTTTSSDLRSNDERMASWVADEPIEAVFKTYKAYIDDEYTARGLLGDHIGQDSHFYGDNAEIAVKMVGNPLGRITYLHFDLQERGESTSVTAWWHNRMWREKVGEFRALIE